MYICAIIKHLPHKSPFCFYKKGGGLTGVPVSFVMKIYGGVEVSEENIQPREVAQQSQSSKEG